jgi:hypothetical protein
MSKPLQSKCSVHRKFEAIISYLLLSGFSPNSTYKSEIWRWSVVAGTNDNECPSKPVHVALQVLICPFVAGNEQGHQYSFNKSSRSFVIGLEATSLTWLEPNSTTDGQICRVSSATGSIWLLILSTNQHSIWCVQVLWADKVLHYDNLWWPQAAVKTCHQVNLKPKTCAIRCKIEFIAYNT